MAEQATGQRRPFGRGAGSTTSTNKPAGRDARNQNRNTPNHKVRSTEKFKGANDKLSGNIFDYGGPRNQDGFIRTMKAIINYIGQDHDYPGDIQNTVETLKLYTVPMPEEPNDYGMATVDKTQALIYEITINRVISREEKLQDNLAKTFALVWGQCTNSLKAKLESLTEWTTIHRDKDALTLITEIKNIIYRFEDQSYLMHSLFRANELVYLIKQEEDETNVKYYERFCNMVEAAEQYGASFGIDDACIGTNEEFKTLSINDKLDQANIDAAKIRTREHYLAYAFIDCLDWGRYAGLKK
jgi:hypothetical protein